MSEKFQYIFQTFWTIFVTYKFCQNQKRYFLETKLLKENTIFLSTCIKTKKMIFKHLLGMLYMDIIQYTWNIYIHVFDFNSKNMFVRSRAYTNCRIYNQINTNTRQEGLIVRQINNLQERKTNLRKCKRKQERFILVRSSWPTSSPQATRLRFSFNLDFATQNQYTMYTTWQIPFAKCIHLLFHQENTFSSTKRIPSPCTTASTTKKPPVYNDHFENYNSFPIALVLNVYVDKV